MNFKPLFDGEYNNIECVDHSKQKLPCVLRNSCKYSLHQSTEMKNYSFRTNITTFISELLKVKSSCIPYNVSADSDRVDVDNNCDNSSIQKMRKIIRIK